MSSSNDTPALFNRRFLTTNSGSFKNGDAVNAVNDNSQINDVVYTFETTTISVRRIRPSNATNIFIDTLDISNKLKNDDTNQHDRANYNDKNMMVEEVKNNKNHNNNTLMNYNCVLRPPATKDSKSKTIKSPLSISTTSTDDNRSNTNTNTCEQLKEIETVIHRSEMYLAHQYGTTNGGSCHNGVDSSSKSRFPNGHSSTTAGHYHRSNSGRSSTSSGAYSNSDKLPSTSTSDDVDELAGLPEGNVDSDEEDDDSCPSGDSLMELRDNVRECLEKDPNDRTDDDIHILLEFMQHMPAFANLPICLKRELCWKMVFAVVEKAYTTVMRDGEQLDSWCVIVNGEVEVILSDGSKLEYHLGDSFGVEPRSDVQYHCGQMRTLIDDCQFVLVAQQDYVQILSKVSTNLRKHTDAAGEIVSETERRTFDNNKEGYVLVKGKAEKLLQALIDDKEVALDQFYVEDFLLMYRTFIEKSTEIFEKFLYWFTELHLREKVARLVLLWVNNHFNDFETDCQMMKLLEQFEQALEREGMTNHQQLLNIACSVKSRPRTLIYTRSNREEILHFSILGGQEKSFGIFVSQVEPNSQIEKVGLKRGDQILEVNGTNFQISISHQKALEILRNSTHLSLTVKSNLLGFKEMVSATDKLDETPVAAGSVLANRHRSTGSRNVPELLVNKRPKMPLLHHTHSCTDAQMLTIVHTSTPVPPMVHLKSAEKEISRFGKLLKKLKQGHSISLLQKDEDQSDCDGSYNPTANYYHRPPAYPLKHSRSNPDLSVHLVNGLSQYYQPVRSQSPEHVLKIYRSDQTFKYLSVYKETTSHNVVQLALQEFGMAAGDSSSLEWSLTEVSVTPEGVIKQKRLPDQMQNLAERIALNSRYYLKSNKLSEPLVPDLLAPELVKESQTTLLQLNANILAAQLTLQDFSIFSSIESTEYVDCIFNLTQSKFGWRKLTQFEELVNREMWWVVTEVCQEKNLLRRAKIIKKFIKLARRCRDFKNFNSMFAIMSGLEKPAVRRLHNSWDKISSKYLKMFEDLQLLLDPSRNMSKYRQHLTKMALVPPVIPLFPVVRKDLYFIHECNQTWSDGLVNFEKLRMIAKEIRAINKLSSVPYELSSMFEQTGAGRLNDALLHMNTFEGGASVATMRKQYVQRAPLSRKKLYEQALMVRRCKSYLSALQVVDNEYELDALSFELEPQPNSGGLQSQSKRPLPSPSMSSCSSLSVNSDKTRRVPKFGVESPHAVQKMLALVDHSRVRPSIPRQSSPTTSPRPQLRLHRLYYPVHLVSNGHGRSQSDTTNPLLMPVDLTAESSSVTTLLSASRMLSSGSTTSNESSSTQSCAGSLAKVPYGISSDSNDSGHCTVDSNSVGSQNSPYSQKKLFILNDPNRHNKTSHYAVPAHLPHPPPGYCSSHVPRKSRFVSTPAVAPFVVRRTNSIPSSADIQNYFDRFDDLGEQVSRV